jgi:hypothetical protein
MRLKHMGVPNPCSISWDSMSGSDRVRNCARCSRNVYHLSRMTKKEIRNLILTQEGRLCVTFDRDRSGRIKPLVQRPKLKLMQQRLLNVTGAALAAVLSLNPNVFASNSLSNNSNRAISHRHSSELFIPLSQNSNEDGVVLGTVFDSNQAVIAGAEITLVNEQTEQTYNTRTSEEGTYRLSNPISGTYRLNVSSPGFRQTEIKGINLRTRHEVKLDVTLQVGTVGELVPVYRQRSPYPLPRIITAPFRAFRKVLS